MPLMTGLGELRRDLPVGTEQLDAFEVGRYTRNDHPKSGILSPEVSGKSPVSCRISKNDDTTGKFQCQSTIERSGTYINPPSSNSLMPNVRALIFKQHPELTPTSFFTSMRASRRLSQTVSAYVSVKPWVTSQFLAST